MNMNKCEIMEITQEDLPKCSSFWGYPNTRIEEFLKSGTRRVFTCKIGDVYVGGCALIIGENQYGHFSDFCVQKDLRGKGIGSYILEFAINFLKEKGIKSIRLHVLKNNSSAIKLYKKYNFEYLEDVTPEKIAMVKKL